MKEPKEPQENRKILVVGRGNHFPEEAMDYALQVAERLGFDLVAVSVSPDPDEVGPYLTPYRKYLEDDFTRRASLAASIFREKALAKGLNFRHLVKFGDLAQVVERLPREIRRVEFVLDASDSQDNQVCDRVNLPCFTLTPSMTTSIFEGEKIRERSLSMRPIGKTLGFGLATAALYAAVFWQSDLVMQLFTRGGWYAALPIATAFMFSFVHGAFANYLWQALGVEATKKVVTTRPAVAKRPRRRPRPTLRLNA